MIGLVIVSHSARLAEGVCELARQASRDSVPIAAAAGSPDPANPLGTDAFQVLAAIDSVYSEDGVLLLMDLGSAVLSAETALDLLPAERRAHVHLCPAPLVEGAVAAASQAAAGAALPEILREANRALAAKTAQSGDGLPAGEPCEEAVVAVANRLGLHARPASHLIRLARRFAAHLTLENLTRAAGPVDAGSIGGVLGLGARHGHRLRIRALGEAARQAVDAVSAFLAAADEHQDPAAPAVAPSPAGIPGRLHGIPASAGIAIGPLVRFQPALPDLPPRTVDDPPAERRRFLAAVQALHDDIRALAGDSPIFEAHVLFLDDPSLLAAVSQAILDHGLSAEFAWRQETSRLADRLASLDDPYLRARAPDVADVAARLLRRLTGLPTPAPLLPSPSILVARDLTPSEVQSLDPATCLGFCLESGSALAHSVILARARGIPAVVGLGPQISTPPEGAQLALDGDRGTVWVDPAPAELADLQFRRANWLAARTAAEALRHTPASTRDGRPIRVVANISGVAEAAEAVEWGAEGVGVLRTEFLFMNRAQAPGEAEQLAAYRAIAHSLGGRPLVIRTLDIGGDKPVPYIEIGPESNPFLGWRGIRLTLGRRDLFRTQLRAILRAAAAYPVAILLPMITSPGEIRQTRALLSEVASELEREQESFRPDVPLGVMIEAPAAVAVADQLARQADFLSLGTNDLIQYLMAADRTNARVAPLADPFQPAVLHSIRRTVDAARQARIEVTLCGELAADPLATPLLLGLGIEEFSLSAPLIPELKRAIARCTTAESRAIARQALELDSCAAVRSLLARYAAS